MDYSFETVQNIFDEYELLEIEKGVLIAGGRKNHSLYDTVSLVAMVKFAAVWVRATENERSRSTIDIKTVTEDDYNYAFSEQAKEVYDCIMAKSIQAMLNDGKLMNQETLSEEVSKDNIYKYVPSIVKGLYSNDKYLETFDNWVRKASGISVITEGRNSRMRR